VYVCVCGGGGGHPVSLPLHDETRQKIECMQNSYALYGVWQNLSLTGIKISYLPQNTFPCVNVRGGEEAIHFSHYFFVVFSHI
jgi:hypothetical protein